MDGEDDMEQDRNALAIHKPVTLMFGYNTYVMEQRAATKIIEWLRESPMIYKVDSRYVDGVSVPTLNPVEAREITMGVVTQAYILTGLENAKRKS